MKTKKIYAPPSMNTDNASNITELRIKKGEAVLKGQLLVILESGNYRLDLVAEEDCIIHKIHCSQGQNVTRNALLFETQLT